MSAQPVVAFGELLMRLDTPLYERFSQASNLRVTYTGGEGNLAVALAQWGFETRLVSRVPNHDLGTACLNHFRRYGVDVRFVARGGERLGMLFVETGAAQRPAKVIYDRSHSSFRTLDPAEFDWERILENAGWLHFTGTAPALGDPVLALLRVALQMAQQRSIPVSLDVSYRSALWTVAEAAQVLPTLLPFVDLLIGSESDAQLFFGINDSGAAALQELCQKYSLRGAAFTERSVQPDGTNRYSALVGTATQCHSSRSYDIDVIDRIGAGDAFAAAVVRGLMLSEPLDQLTEQATAAAVLCHSIPGDFALVSWDEVRALADAGSGPHTGRGWR